MMAVIVTVLAQSCAAMLPPSNAEIEWFRDGRPWARDIPVGASSGSRVYRREFRSGGVSERAVSCVTQRRTAYLVDRVGGETVRIPVLLEQGDTRTSDGAVIRRVTPPDGAGHARTTVWFSVAEPGVSLYAVARGMGIVEVRTPAPAGGVSILRGVRSEASLAARRDSVAFSEQRRMLLDRILFLERMEYALRDSLLTLLGVIDSLRAALPDTAVGGGA